MSNYGPPPSFGLPYNPNAPTAPASGFGYTTPQYAYQHQQQHHGYIQPQVQLSGTNPAQYVNGYAYNTNAQNGNVPTYVNGTGPSPFAPLPQPAQHPPNLSLPQNGPYRPSPFANVPPSQAQMSSTSTIPQKVFSENHARPQNSEKEHQSREDLTEKSLPSEQELEDGEINSGEPSDTGEVADRSGPEQEFSSVGQNMLPGSRLRSDPHRLAHDLVLEMHSWGLSYQDFINEGMNADLLRSIYAECNLPIVTKATRSHQSLQAATKVPPVAISNRVPTPEATPAVTKISRSPEPSTQGKATNEFVDTKPMDRKALIAQKLAAKNAKPAGTPGNAATAATVGNEKLSPVAVDMLSVKSIEPAGTHAPKQGPQLLVNPQPVQESPLDMEAKRKAQTELARQRMEALKQKVSTKKENRPSLNTDPGKESTPYTPAALNAVASGVTQRMDTEDTEPIVQVQSSMASYFSPVLQTPMFSIPGLFPAAGPAVQQEPDQSTIQNANQSNATPLSNSPTPPIVPADLPQQPLDAIKPAQPNPGKVGGPLSRRRHKASDFLDSPPSKVKRPLVQDDMEVVIEISDDEDAESSDDSDVAILKENDRLALSGQSKTGASNQRAARNLPALSDFPTRRAPGTDSATVTPSAMLTPGKMQEPKELKRTEMEIELMNRKIAELEQRIRAKNAVSRTQSPGIPAQATTICTPFDAVSDGTEKSMRQDGIPMEPKDLKGSSAITGIDLATKGELLVEKENQERNVARAEAELAQPIQQCDFGQVIPAARQKPSIQASAGGHPHSNHDVQSSIDHYSLQAQQEVEGQDFQHIRMEEYLPDYPPTSQIREPLPVEKEGLAQHEQLQQEQPELQRRALNAQRGSRKSEIESGLPLLDEEIERTTRQLQSLREQEAHLEAQIQKGIDGRQMLLDELRRLSQATEAMQFDETVDEQGQSEAAMQSSQDSAGTSPCIL